MNLSLRLQFAIFLFISATHAWTFVWTDADGGAHIKTGGPDEPQPCTEMNMPRGKEYSWDPEGSEFCIDLFKDKNCQQQNGLSCSRWPKHPSGQDWVRSWRVRLNKTATSSTLTTTTSPPSSSSPSPTETTTTAPPTETTSSSTSEPAPGTETEPTEPSASNGPSLSGGAIAGVVIGALAGVGVMVAFGVLAARRRRRGKPTASGPPADKSPPPTEEAPPYQPPELDSQAASPVAPSPSAPAPAYQSFQPEKGDAGVGYGNNRPPMAELPDQVPVAELPDHSPAAEMEATEPTVKK